MPVENATPNRNYPLPFKENELQDDVARLIGAITGIDLDIANILVSLALKSENGHGHVISDITGLAAALAAKQDADQKGLANGFASLGADGKVPAGQLPSAVFGALSYQGTWNANTNAPTILAANASNKGWYFKVATAGATSIGGIDDWKIGDWIVSNGTGWDKVDNTESVVSVAGLTGAIGAAALLAAIGAATAAQGTKADSAVQPGDLGSAAYAAVSSFLAAGAKAVDSAKLNGAVESYTDTAHSIAKRNSSGDLETRLFRSTYGVSGSLPGNREFIMRGSAGDPYLRPITTAAAAAALKPHLGNDVYTGSSRDQTNFPVGHPIAVWGATSIARNSSLSPRLDSTHSYKVSGSGSLLSGIWRSRGRFHNDGVIAERTG
ncbi:hypothetical protein JYP49_21840 [Nitratireductor aquimarinus]|uniref:hypothetical protein n=1 Tax=Nitratireductor TaxID=245876 RepID=UPI0019D3766D|nr:MULTISPECIES: hypothetical protein [Nitratireductor]MBN7778902.1 hypothetical protein [Nitratireductor pacificus]MBN7783239.1 hypothetical protein [Nitratireductor pacificus]MBN7792040.1 hypothetical protein [Nitratireductor aquimarinus]MBY6101306.1 hypothetical protein [Nitratireductor aquimarinus]MCA1263005.1 hypothetical protein [Nitratireductor aquimarinus]